MAVNTAKVEGRRKVDYKSLQEVVDDADRLSAGHVKAIGNWSPARSTGTSPSRSMARSTACRTPFHGTCA